MSEETDDAMISAAKRAARTGDQILEFAAALARIDFKPRQVQHRIDEIMYTSYKLPCSLGLELLPRIFALLGPDVVRALVTGSPIPGGVVGRLAACAADADLVPIARSLLSRMKCGSLRGEAKSSGDVLEDFDEHFAGEYFHLLKVCVFALAHNFRGPTYGTR